MPLRRRLGTALLRPYLTHELIHRSATYDAITDRDQRRVLSGRVIQLQHILDGKAGKR